MTAGDVCDFTGKLIAIFLIVFGCVVARSQVFYSHKDHIVLLNVTNFKDTVHNAETAWFVEFYNSWCGHCIRFAPTWKRLARDVKYWDQAIQLAAVDCSIEANAPVCRDYEIKGYPTLKFFPHKSPVGQKGLECQGKRNREEMRGGMLKYLSELQQQIASPHLDRLVPLRNMEDIWKDVTAATEFTVVFFEESNSSLGQEVILDMMKHKKLLIRRLLREDVQKYVMKEFPAMYLIHKGGTFNKITASVADRKGFVRALYKVMDIEEPEEEEEDVSAEAEGDEEEEEEESQQAKEEDGLGDQGLGAGQGMLRVDNRFHDSAGKDSEIQMQYAVHQQDLESALQYSLQHEVASYSKIEGEGLVALKAYVSVLSKYFPGPEPVVGFLKKLNNWLRSADGMFSADTWLRTLKSLQERGAVLPDQVKWTGCRGSDPKYRGYPCSLWTLFHVLSVNSVLDYPQEMTFDPTEVLGAMRGYVKHFFGCRECSENFMKGAVHIEERVRSPDESILFLWRSHNKANFHLAGDLTEDPKHPKVQFPPKELCPACHAGLTDTGPTWAEQFVVQFLKSMYSRHSIIQDSEQSGVSVTTRRASLKEPLRSQGVLSRSTRPKHSSDAKKQADGKYIHQQKTDVFSDSERRKADLEIIAQKRAQKREDLKAALQPLWKAKPEYDANRIEMLKRRELETRITGHAVFTAWGFNSIDVSMCVMFYLMCTAIIVLMYFHLMVHRKMRPSGCCKLLPV